MFSRIRNFSALLLLVIHLLHGADKTDAIVAPLPTTNLNSYHISINPSHGRMSANKDLQLVSLTKCQTRKRHDYTKLFFKNYC